MPTKFDPQSERSWMTGPCSTKNLQRAFTRLEVSMALMTSVWIAHTVIHVNSTAQRLV